MYTVFSYVHLSSYFNILYSFSDCCSWLDILIKIYRYHLI
jgi:hypothetical protein